MTISKTDLFYFSICMIGSECEQMAIFHFLHHLRVISWRKVWKVFIFQRVLGGLEPTKRFLFFGVFVTSLVLLPQGKTQREPDQEQESCSVAHRNLLQQRKWSKKTVSPLTMFYDARLSVLLYYILIQDRRMKSWIISVELLLSDSDNTLTMSHNSCKDIVKTYKGGVFHQSAGAFATPN